jgi:hypothetical protein
MELTVDISALVFGTMETIHLVISATYAPRNPEAISSSVMVIESSRTSTVTGAVVQPAIRIKAVPILLVAKLVIDVIDRVYNVLLLWDRQ